MSPLSIYPDPAEPGGHSGFGRADDCVQPGEVIAGHFRLKRLLLRQGPALTWLAADDNLGRPVLAHVLPAGAPAIGRVLAAAQAAGSTTDGLFLRVLDASPVHGRPYGAYVLSEYAPGQSLERALGEGLLVPDEACWVARQLAEGLDGIHRRGSHHGRVDPETVVLTTSGDVKVLGFVLADALAQHGGVRTTGERDDVEAIGRVLYASLLGRWPGGPAFGLPAASVDGRRFPLSPHLADSRVPADVSDVADRILNPVASGRAELRTARDVMAALSEVLGDDPSRAGRRMRVPGPQVARERAMGASAWAPVPRQGTAPLHQPTPSDAPTTAVPMVATAVTVPVQAAGATEAGLVTPGVDPLAEPRRIWFRLLTAAFVIALVGGLVGVASRGVRLLPVGHEVIATVGVRDFDPKTDGGDEAENPAQLALATDAQAATAWKTERYGRSAAFNGRKPGVGLLVDLGGFRTVTTVKVTLDGATDVQLRVPAVTDATTASMRSQSDWVTVATATGATGEVTLSPGAALSTRFLLVYLTKLPDLGGGQGFQGSVAEIVVVS